jgi:predicted ATPase
LLKEIQFLEHRSDAKLYPFNIPALAGLKQIPIRQAVTFFIGENGSGKSTLLEAVASLCGFGAAGGSKHYLRESREADALLSNHMRLSWQPKITDGFFLRAESFYNLASYVDELAASGPDILNAYGGVSLHEQSHGEAFFSLFTHRFGRRGIYLLDEPEAALSPARQLAFLRLIWQLARQGGAQFLIATHSPILLAYPGADIYSLDYAPLKLIDYERTEHYRLTLAFLSNREQFLRHLLEDE